MAIIIQTISKYTYTTQVTGGGSGTNYIDIAGGDYVQFHDDRSDYADKVISDRFVMIK